MLRLGLMLSLLVLGGCGAVRLWDSRPPEIVIPASFTDVRCRDHARHRAEDSAVFGYPPEIQVRVARDVYASCIDAGSWPPARTR